MSDYPYIKRELETLILRHLKDPEVLAIVGPRQCGKTTLLKNIAGSLPASVFLSFEDRRVLDLLSRLKPPAPARGLRESRRGRICYDVVKCNSVRVLTVYIKPSTTSSGFLDIGARYS